MSVDPLVQLEHDFQWPKMAFCHLYNLTMAGNSKTQLLTLQELDFWQTVGFFSFIEFNTAINVSQCTEEGGPSQL